MPNSHNTLLLAQEYTREFVLGLESGRAAVRLASKTYTAEGVMFLAEDCEASREIKESDPYNPESHLAFVTGIFEGVNLDMLRQSEGVTV